MKIGILSTSKGSLGDATRNLKFYEILQSMGFDVAMINPIEGSVTSLDPGISSRLATIPSNLWQMMLKTPFAKVPLLHRFVYDYLAKTRSRDVMRLIRRENIDLLQAETHQAAEIALSLKRDFGIPYIFDMHGLSSVEEYDVVHSPSTRFLSYLRKREAEMILNAEEVFVVGNTLKNYLEFTYGLQNVSVVPCGSDPYPGLQKSHGIPLKVIYAGAFEYFERVDDYLDAIRILGNKDYRFYIAGDGSLREPILKRIAEENLPIEYLGCLPRDGLRELLKEMHIGVAPEANEECQKFNSSVKTFEYMSMGLAVVCATVGEVGQVLKDQDCGVLVPPEDPEAIADALRLYKDERLWTRHSNNGIGLTESVFSWERIIGEVRPIYEKYIQ